MQTSPHETGQKFLVKPSPFVQTQGAAWARGSSWFRMCLHKREGLGGTTQLAPPLVSPLTLRRPRARSSELANPAVPRHANAIAWTRPWVSV